MLFLVDVRHVPKKMDHYVNSVSPLPRPEIGTVVPVSALRTGTARSGVVSGCVKARINGEQWSPLPALCGAGDDSERWVGV